MIRNPNSSLEVAPVLGQLRHERSKLFKWSETDLLAGQAYLETLLAAGQLTPDDAKILVKVRKHLSELSALKADGDLMP
jgi:hypothetical protein